MQARQRQVFRPGVAFSARIAGAIIASTAAIEDPIEALEARASSGGR